MLPEQKAYIFAWMDAVTAAGFRAGVYCSGIPAREGKVSIVTADDIQQNAGGRKIAFFVTDDVCPPSPGCAFPRKPPAPMESGINFTDVWQFAQSPKRKGFAAKCPANYNADGNCYPPDGDSTLRLHVDVDVTGDAGARSLAEVDGGEGVRVASPAAGGGSDDRPAPRSADRRRRCRRSASSH
jgi:hypothetical protein